MDRETIVKTINNLLVKEFELDESAIVPNAHLKDDLGLESLDFVDIAVIVKKEYGITLKGTEVSSIRTMNDLYDYIYNYTQNR
ncbi:MAG: phosphopantetheine-binding protein [Bacteroidales bacterium]|jgi:acyl carrier protein